jgi:hypothetical protein
LFLLSFCFALLCCELSLRRDHHSHSHQQMLALALSFFFVTLGGETIANL